MLAEIHPRVILLDEVSMGLAPKVVDAIFEFFGLLRNQGASLLLVEKYTFIIDGLGFRVSDQIVGGLATFARIEHDHHNLLIYSAPVSHLNHYAIEMDDLDAIGKAGQEVIAERADASVVGIGRHFLGSNIFWYLTDPAGTMFELFSDMDQIVDEDAWARDIGRRDWGASDTPAPFSVWGPREPDTFFNPVDLAAIGASREALGLD